MQLRQPELVRAVDENRVRARDIDAGLDDRRTKQQVAALLIELAHDSLELALGHLAMGDGDTCFGHQLGELLAHRHDRVDVVVQEIDLAAALEFAQARFAHDAG